MVRVSFAGNVIVLSLSMCSFRLAAKGEDVKQFTIIYPSVFNIKLYCLISYDIGNSNFYIIYGIGTENISFINKREFLCT